MAAARRPPRSDPQNNHDFLPNAMPQRSFGGVVREADAAIVQEACEGGPALEHIVHGLGQIVTAGELGALLAHIGFQIGDERRALCLPNNLSLVGVASHRSTSVR
jgi:hypothetical protein